MSSSTASSSSCECCTDQSEISFIEYGKGQVRVTKVRKDTPRVGVSQVLEVAVSVLLQGDFVPSFVNADNSLVVPTDTCKNTIYFLARDHLNDDVEAFGMSVVRHFLATYKHVSRVQCSLEQTVWSRVVIDGTGHEHTFTRSPEKRLAEVVGDRESIQVSGGLAELRIMKTTGSGFEGFHKCDLTTLKPVKDRVLATKVTAKWSYTKAAIVKGNSVPFSTIYNRIVSTLIKIFATTYSKSVQATMWEIGQSVIANIPEIQSIFMDFPNIHHWHYDLEKMGGPKNDATQRVQVFFPTDEPFGIIRCTVSRKPQAKL